MWFTLSIPGDPRFLDTVHDVVLRLSEQAGLDAPAACGVAITIHGYLAHALRQAHGVCDGGEFRLGFATGLSGIEVAIGFTACGGGAGLPPDRLWGGHGAPGAVDRVELVTEDGASVCRLVKAIPLPC